NDGPGPLELLPEAYRPVTRCQRACKPPCAELRGEIARGDGDRLEQPLGAEPGGGEDLAATGVDHGEDGPPSGLALRPARERLEAGDAGQRQVAALGEGAGGGDPVAQAGEAARTEADRDPLDVLPVGAGALERLLDEREQAARVLRSLARLRI